MYIETPRLLIRSFFEADAQGLHAILGDEETMRYAEPAYDFEKTQDFLASFCIGQKGAMAAVHKDSGKLIGYLLFKEYEKDIYELGWFINRAYWRQGYAYEACRAIIDYAFEVIHADKVFAETIDTEKSLPLMFKLGMTEETEQNSITTDNEGKQRVFHYCSIVRNG